METVHLLSYELDVNVLLLFLTLRSTALKTYINDVDIFAASEFFVLVVVNICRTFQVSYPKRNIFTEKDGDLLNVHFLSCV